MYTPPLNKKIFFKLALIVLALLAVNNSYGLSTDSQQDLEITADYAELDKQKKTAIYRGNVIVTQGSMRITGHTLEVYFNDADDVETTIMFGTPATYRQLPDNSKIYSTAKSLKIKYYPLRDFVVLMDDAIFTQPDGSQLAGDHIEYDIVKSHVVAKDKDIADKNNNTNRVKITIKKKQDP